MKVLIALFTTLLSLPALSAWQVTEQDSSISFISVKKTDVAEVHHFNGFSGLLSEGGKFTLNIDLASVATGVEVRDQRMQEHLFETKMFPSATVSAQLDMKPLQQLRVGAVLQMDVDAELMLHGQKQALTMPLTIAKLSDKQMLVSARQPVVINAASFDLAKGVAKLQEMAGLPSISNAVPVSFVLNLTAE